MLNCLVFRHASAFPYCTSYEVYRTVMHETPSIVPMCGKDGTRIVELTMECKVFPVADASPDRLSSDYLTGWRGTSFSDDFDNLTNEAKGKLAKRMRALYDPIFKLKGINKTSYDYRDLRAVPGLNSCPSYGIVEDVDWKAKLLAAEDVAPCPCHYSPTQFPCFQSMFYNDSSTPISTLTWARQPTRMKVFWSNLWPSYEREPVEIALNSVIKQLSPMLLIYRPKNQQEALYVC